VDSPEADYLRDTGSASLWGVVLLLLRFRLGALVLLILHEHLLAYAILALVVAFFSMRERRHRRPF
jgi:hypothetical protein